MERVDVTWRLIWGYIGVVLLLILIAMLSGCATRKEKSLAYAAQNPKEFAQFCGDYYPPNDSVGKPTIVYIPADNKNYQQDIDSLSKAIETLKNEVNVDERDCAKEYKPIVDRLSKQVKDLKEAYKPCEPDTAYVSTTVYRTNMGKVVFLQGEVDKFKALYQKEKDTKTKLIYWLAGISFLLLAALALLIFKR